MNSFIWKVKAYLYMRKRVGWASWSMVASLYETYSDYDAESAIEEDLSYWD